MSRSWTACLKIRPSGSLIDLTKYERACTQSCNKRLGSDLVWGMSQDQTVCLEVGQPVCKLDILSHWLSWQNMRELACNLVMGFLAVNLCEVWLNIRQYVSKLNDMTQSQTFWLTDCLEPEHERACRQSCYGRLGGDRVWSMSQDQTVCLEVGQPVLKSDILAHWLPWQNMRKLACNLVTGLLAVIVCEVCFKIRQYVLKLDSLSQSWICSLVFLTKDERACMQSCYGRLGSDLVWSISQDQTVCLEVGQPVSKLDILAHWLSWHKTEHSSTSSNKLTCTLVFSPS